MPGPNNALVCKGILALSLSLALPFPALAYVGPGAGLEYVGYALSLAAWVLTAAGALLTWPIYRLLQWLRNGQEFSTKVGEGPDRHVNPGGTESTCQPGPVLATSESTKAESTLSIEAKLSKINSCIRNG